MRFYSDIELFLVKYVQHTQYYVVQFAEAHKNNW